MRGQAPGRSRPRSRVAAQDAPGGEAGAAQGAVLAQGFDGVFAASWARSGSSRRSAGAASTDRCAPAPRPRRPPGFMAGPVAGEGAGAGRPAGPRRRGARAVAPDQHEVDAGAGRPGEQQARGFLQPAAGAVAHHGVADLFGHGEAEARRRRVVAAHERLQHQAGLGPCGPWRRRAGTRRGASGAAAGDVMEASRPGAAAWPLRPTGACGPWRGGWPAPCGRRRWPCGRESRGGAYGPASRVDRCASRRSPTEEGGRTRPAGAPGRRRLIGVGCEAVNPGCPVARAFLDR